MPHHIVIGTGISGLATACCLARSGHQVTVLEKNASLGGRARAFEADGFFFDMGPSWYWMPDVFEQFFSLFGKTAADFYQLVRLDPGFRIFFREGEPLDVPADADALDQLFERIEPGSSRQLKRFLDDAELKYREGMLQLAYQPSLSVREFMNMRLLKKVVHLSLFRSSRNHIARYFRDPRLIQLMEFPLYSIDRELIDSFLRSMRCDLSKTAYDDAGYSEYIYGSAEVVGLMCLKVFTENDPGLYESLRPQARRLGAAFQKINFLRDLKMDNEYLGRTYFPSVDLMKLTTSDKIRIERKRC